jgi:transcriptional regulator with XRE-family HTH domain
MKPQVDLQEVDLRMVSPHLGECFRQLRKEAGLTQQSIAEKAKVSRCTVSDFENSKRPSVGVTHVESMAHAVGSTYMLLVAMADKASQQQPRCLK